MLNLLALTSFISGEASISWLYTCLANFEVIKIEFLNSSSDVFTFFFFFLFLQTELLTIETYYNNVFTNFVHGWKSNL